MRPSRERIPRGDAAETALPTTEEKVDHLVPASGLLGLGVVTAQAGQREGQQRKRSETLTLQQAARPTVATGPQKRACRGLCLRSGRIVVGHSTCGTQKGGKLIMTKRPEGTSRHPNYTVQVML